MATKKRTDPLKTSVEKLVDRSRSPAEQVARRVEQLQRENPTFSHGTCLVLAKRELAKP